MKKINITEENFDLKVKIKNGEIKPSGNEIADILIENGMLRIKLPESIADITDAKAFLYDTKEKRTVSFANAAIEGRDILIGFNSILIKGLLAGAYSFLRICLAVRNDSEYSCFYIRKGFGADEKYVEEKNYIGLICSSDAKSEEEKKCLLCYYSSLGLLSVYTKKSDSEKLADIAAGNLETVELSLNENILTAVIHYSAQDQLYKNIIFSLSSSAGKLLPYESDFSSTDEITVIELKFDLTKLPAKTEYSFSFGLCDAEIAVFIPPNIKYKNIVSGKYYCFSEPETNGKVHVSFSADNNCFNITYYNNVYNAIISVIMAVYNTELFVAEAIESVLDQKTEKISEAIKKDPYTVYKNIFELILVDDGSTDSSGEICDRYADVYSNIRVIHKENGGVSSARNMGIEVADAKYLNFMDSDDKFSDNVFEECFEFFEKHYDEVNVITFPLKFFDAKTGDHWQNEKFLKGDRVVDLEKDYDVSVFNVNSSFFKADIIKNNNKYFDVNLQIAEDTKYVYDIIISTNSCLGLVSKCVYWYRRRSTGELSAIQALKNNVNNYDQFFTCFLNEIVDTTIEKIGYVPKYVQSGIMKQLAWRFIEDVDGLNVINLLGEAGYIKYKERIFDLLQYIDSDVIMSMKKIYREQKYYVLSKKDPEHINIVIEGSDVFYKYEDIEVSRASNHYIRLEFLKINNNHISFEGYGMSYESDSKFVVKVNDQFYPVTVVQSHDKNVYSLNDVIFRSTSFVFDFEADPNVESYDIVFYEIISGVYVEKKDIRYHKSFPLSYSFDESYFAKDGWIIKREKNTFKLINLLYSLDSLNTCKDFESKFISQLEKSPNCKNNLFKSAISLRKKLMSIYMEYHMFRKKKIWLVSDRVNMAGDNGEAMFLYLTAKNDPDIDLYFVIGKDCPDYERMQQYGKVIDRYSEEFKILYLLSDVNISSHADEFIIDPFFDDKTTDVFRDLVYRPKYVFLQHGVIKDDLSNWLNRFNKDISGFITAAYPEYQSILDYNYFYTEKEVWLTGLPRHDRLYHDEKRYITIMPTWRKYLSEFSKENANVRVVVNNFKERAFYKFYNALINNEKLISAAKEYNYQICFMPHPNIMTVMDQFDKNPDVLFFGFDKPYREIYAESDLVITDYSSSVMDFAYLRKPVLYCHFDKEEFFAGDHVYVPGYFDYERDGFGEVTYELDSLVDEIIEYMKNDCRLKDIYRERMDKFFAFSDKNNCERVYKKLKEMDS